MTARKEKKLRTEHLKLMEKLVESPGGQAGRKIEATIRKIEKKLGWGK